LELLLKTRNITDPLEINRFINTPTLNDLFAELPSELRVSLKHATENILQAMRDSRPIVVHGDYDADGICATTILYNTLKNELCYEKTLFFIPNRFAHGYGVSKKSVDGFVLWLNLNFLAQTQYCS
jgi:single-stranded-DNA-specific exonuclease